MAVSRYVAFLLTPNNALEESDSCFIINPEYIGDTFLCIITFL
jgi:hypothetical protein